MFLQIAIILGGLALTIYVFTNIFKKKPTPFKVPDPIIFPTPTPDNPVEGGEDGGEGEMPTKPIPVNCQLAAFMAAPQEYSYYDCCGNPHYGMGFEPWEKRAPVAIDANKEFVGVELIGQETDFNCLEEQ